MKPGTPVLRSTRLLDQARERIRYLHYSLSTEKAYLHWVRFFVRWHGRNGEMQHPRDMAAAGVEALVKRRANEGCVPTSTQWLFATEWPLTEKRLNVSSGSPAVHVSRAPP